ncbi:MAG: ABC transporter permease [Candidatus Babeliales bacterium]
MKRMWQWGQYALDTMGRVVLDRCNAVGQFVLFLATVLQISVSTRPKFNKILYQMDRIGVGSCLIVVLTGTFAGAVLAFQSYIGFKRFGSEDLIGPLVALSMTRELGPVLTGLMVTGRAGSAIAAEIGTMQITEQIDALRTLSIDIWQYLMVPRMFASVFILPFLTIFTMICGIIGGYIIAVYALHLNGEQYLQGIARYLEFSDIKNGLIKSAVFGLILSWVGCYKGYRTQGGARGVGIATTQAVVISSVIILIANYFLTALLFE